MGWRSSVSCRRCSWYTHLTSGTSRHLADRWYATENLIYFLICPWNYISLPCLTCTTYSSFSLCFGRQVCAQSLHISHTTIVDAFTLLIDVHVSNRLYLLRIVRYHDSQISVLKLKLGWMTLSRHCYQQKSGKNGCKNSWDFHSKGFWCMSIDTNKHLSVTANTNNS